MAWNTGTPKPGKGAIILWADRSGRRRRRRSRFSCCATIRASWSGRRITRRRSRVGSWSRRRGRIPESTQGLNRYTYAANNPLSFTDPSGYFLGKLFKAIGKFFKKVIKAITGVTTAVHGGDVGDIFKAAAIAWGTAKAFHFVGHGMGLPENPEFLTGPHLFKTVAHGVVGGTARELSGGKFKHGFLAAGAAQFAAPYIDTLDAGNTGVSPARVAAAAAVGGTASELGGGKFANGAVTAAFGRLFNDELRYERSSKSRNFWLRAKNEL